MRILRRASGTTGQSGFTRDMAQRAMEQLFAQEGASRADIEAYYKFMNPEDEKLSEKEKELGRMYSAAISLVDELEANYQFSGAGQFGEGLGARKAGGELAVTARKGENWAAQNYIDTKKAFSSSLKAVVGEAGPMTKDDIDRLTNIFPNLSLTASSTGAESYGKFVGARKQLAKYFGEEPTKTTWTINNPTPEQKEQIEKRYGVKLPTGQIEPTGPEPTEPTTTTQPTTYTPTAAGLAAGIQQPTTTPAWLESLAGFQEYLGRSQALPLAYGTIGGTLGATVGHPHIGGAIGAAGGERLKQLMAGGKVGDVGAQVGATAKGLVSGAGTRATQFGLEKFLGPLVGRVARKPLQGLLQKVGGSATTPTAGAIEAVGQQAGRLSTAVEPGGGAEGKRLLSWLTQQGAKIPTLATKQELVPSYSGLGEQGKGLYDYLSKQLAQQAPATRPINALLSAGYKQILPDWLKRWLGYSAVGTVAGAAGYKTFR